MSYRDHIMGQAKSLGIAVVKDERANACSIILCARVQPSQFNDNILSVCASCGAEIMHRPHVPPGKKLCTECGFKHIQAVQRETGKRPSMVITERTAQEVALITGPTKGKA